ncbi:hypothetical protein C4577_02080 [Candidatus Parcubacteria bacterium]|nr:MAG: hypothetical protein C4577_02080 [Candidatus Parcubacteria bacterium]
MRSVLLVIRADFGTYFAIEMMLHEALDIISKHKDSKLPKILSGTTPNGGAWSVESSKITLMHTQEIDRTAMSQQQQSPIGTLPLINWKGSGI